MPPLPSDRALRRAVAELAITAPEDVEAILHDLPPAHAKRVRALLSEYLAVEVAAAPVAISPHERDYRRVRDLSPWLRLRLEADRPGETFNMTETARDALRRCASATPMEELGTVEHLFAQTRRLFQGARPSRAVGLGERF